MADPLALASGLVHELVSRVQNVRINEAGCQLLANLAEQTMTILGQLEERQFEATVATALELVTAALTEARDAVAKCCKTNFFSAMLYHESYASALKHAAEKLEHALSQIPLATVGMAADMQSDVVELSTLIRKARFEERAAAAHQTIAMKGWLEEKLDQVGQRIKEEVTRPFLEFISRQPIAREQTNDTLLFMKHEEDEASKTKENKDQFGFPKNHSLVCEKLGDAIEAPRVAHDVSDCFRCPITDELMSDPVVLKDSGITYDRSSIEAWLRAGHRHDPVRGIELTTKELIPNYTLRKACEILPKQFRSSSFVVSPLIRYSKDQLEPGIYEGHGMFSFGSMRVYVSQHLIIVPTGRVVGRTGYLSNRMKVENKTHKIGVGKWNNETRELTLEDNQYRYEGSVNFSARDDQMRLEWNGRVTKAEASNEGCGFALACFSPCRVLRGPLHPTTLQMEGHTVPGTSKTQYKSKIVLALKVGYTISGWTYFASKSKEFKIMGRIVEGHWNDNGRLDFMIHFSPGSTIKDTSSSPIESSDVFNVVGNITHDERLHDPFLATTITSLRNVGTTRNDARDPLPIYGLKYWEYASICEVSVPSCDLIYCFTQNAAQDASPLSDWKHGDITECQVSVSSCDLAYCLKLTLTLS